VFSGISVAVANDSKIGLIGQNGIGKTSLLSMMAGINQPTRGSVTLARGKRLGYLRQEAVEAFADRSNTVYEEMLTVFAYLQTQQARLNSLEAQMAAGEYSPELLETYGELQRQFESPGHPGARSASRSVARLCRHDPVGFARPLSDRPDGDTDLEPVRWQAANLQRHLSRFRAAKLRPAECQQWDGWEQRPGSLQVAPGALTLQTTFAWEWERVAA